MREQIFGPTHSIYVPLSPEAGVNYENDCTYIETHEKEFYSELFMGDKTVFLFETVYFKLSSELDLLWLDYAEEETIPFEKLEPAKRIAESIMQQQTDEKKKELIQHFIDLLQKAIDCKSCLMVMA